MIGGAVPMTLGEARAMLAAAEQITAEAASSAEVDRLRREFDAAVERHCLMFGFDKAVDQ